MLMLGNLLGFGGGLATVEAAPGGPGVPSGVITFCLTNELNSGDGVSSKSVIFKALVSDLQSQNNVC